MEQKISELLKGVSDYKFLIDVIFSDGIKNGSYQYYDDLEVVAINLYRTLSSKKYIKIFKIKMLII